MGWAKLAELKNKQNAKAHKHDMCYVRFSANLQKHTH